MAAQAPVNHQNNDSGELAKIFSGMGTLGIEEQSLTNILGKWDVEKRHLFRIAISDHFPEDNHLKWWHGEHKFQIEFSRYQVAMTLWGMDHAERDAICVHDVLRQGRHHDHSGRDHQHGHGNGVFMYGKPHVRPLEMLIEVACSRTSDELLRARQAYHSLFKHSMEEDVPIHMLRNFLVALLSAYRYEGRDVDEDVAKKEAEILHAAIKTAAGKKQLPFHDQDFVYIITSRSKARLKKTFDIYHAMYNKPIYEDIANLDTGKEQEEGKKCLRATILCLCYPAIYYSETLKKAMKGEHEEAITRVMVTRAETDMKAIKEAYFKQNKASLEDDIANKTRGNYRAFMLTLLGS